MIVQNGDEALDSNQLRVHFTTADRVLLAALLDRLPR